MSNPNYCNALNMLVSINTNNNLAIAKSLLAVKDSVKSHILPVSSKYSSNIH